MKLILLNICLAIGMCQGDFETNLKMALSFKRRLVLIAKLSMVVKSKIPQEHGLNF